MSLTLLLNGQSRSFSLPDPSTLSAVVAELALKGDRVAIEWNGNIVSRALWPETPINSGDRLEVVHFVGGGAPVSCSSSRSH